MHALQAKSPLTEKPKFTIEDVAVKIAALDREVKYLVNKVKSYRPKTKPKPARESNATENGSNETKTSGGMFHVDDWLLFWFIFHDDCEICYNPVSVPVIIIFIIFIF